MNIEILRTFVKISKATKKEVTRERFAEYIRLYHPEHLCNINIDLIK